MMRRLVIAIDCDDVLVPSTRFIVDEYNRRYGTTVTYARAHESGNEQWGATREEARDRIYDIQLSSEYGAVAPYDDAIHAIKRLAVKHELHLVTARDTKVLGVTEAMIERYFPGCFDALEHVGLDGTKGDICQRLVADALIDDNLKHLTHAAECGVENLFWFGDYPWNKEGSTPRGLIRCASWSDIEREIERIANE